MDTGTPKQRRSLKISAGYKFLFEYRVRRDLEEVAQVARARRGVGHLSFDSRMSRSGARRGENGRLRAQTWSRPACDGSIWQAAEVARAEIRQRRSAGVWWAQPLPSKTCNALCFGRAASRLASCQALALSRLSEAEAS